MTDRYIDEGRVKQKRRTRTAILVAAAQLLAAGSIPSVADAADAADVSRATAYRYFPTQEHLLHEVALDSASRDTDQVVAALPAGGTADQRLDAVVEAVYRLVAGNELAFRTLLRLSMEQKAAGADQAKEGFRRGGRRIGWLQTALAPIHEQLGDERFERLISALSLCTGIETLIVLRDVCGLDESEAEMVTRWAAQALLRASLAESD